MVNLCIFCFKWLILIFYRKLTKVRFTSNFDFVFEIIFNRHYFLILTKHLFFKKLWQGQQPSKVNFEILAKTQN